MTVLNKRTPPEDKPGGVLLLAEVQPERSSGAAGSEPHRPATATCALMKRGHPRTAACRPAQGRPIAPLAALSNLAA